MSLPKRLSGLTSGALLIAACWLYLAPAAQGQTAGASPEQMQVFQGLTPEQQNAISSEFKTLLVRTYSTALTNYRDQEIDYKPLRAKPDDTEVTVKSDVKPTGATQPVSIDYELEKTDNGWKIYDVKVDGVSLVTTYRDTFATEIREHGIDGLIKSLATKNREPLGPKAGKS